MPHHFKLRGIPVTCDTLGELLEAIHAGLADCQSPMETHSALTASIDSQQAVTAAPTKARPHKPQGSGPKRSWQEAQEYAEKHGVTVGEARSILAKQKREATERALSKVKK